MRFKSKLLISFFLLYVAGIAQVNLVPNPGFELGSCPTFMAQWDYCTGWSNCNGNTGSGAWGTPDYYNTCGTLQSPYNPVPPNTGMGYCNPHTGNSMMGLVCHNQPYPNYREYISTHLNCAMIPGSTYTVSFWVTASSAPAVQYNSSHFGVYLSAAAPVQSSFGYINVNPQFEITSVLTNTVWANYTFTINPTGTFNYITLGCFREQSVITTVLQAPGASQPYSNYFIDDIGVYGPATSAFSASTAASNVTCSGLSNGSATVTPASPGSYSYAWSPGNYTTASVNNLPAGMYTCTVADGSGCLNMQMVNITEPSAITSSVVSTNATCFGSTNGSATITPNGGSGPYTFTWTPSGGNNSSAGGFSAGTYTCMVQDANNCANTQTVLITAPSAIIAGISASQLFVCGTPVPVSIASGANGGTTPYAVQWSSGQNTASISVTPSVSTVYTYTLTDAHACTASNSIAITVGGTSASYNYTVPACSDSVVFLNTSAGTNSFMWLFGDGQTSSAASPPPHHYGNGTYSVSLVTDPGTFCADTAQQVITIQNIHPVAAFQYTYSPCNGAATFTNTSQHANGYVWDLGNGTGSTQANAGTTYTAMGTYTVTLQATSASGCKDTAAQVLTVASDFVKAGFSATAAGCGDSTHFTNTSANASSYHWAFDNGTFSNATSPAVAFLQGAHTVTLSAYNGACSDSVMLSINIEAADINTANLPNVFTPNEDGINDVFDFSKLNKCSTYDFEIFDRWGLSILKSTETKTSSWDGRTTSGLPVSAGTYFYILHDKKGGTFRGTVTLFR